MENFIESTIQKVISKYIDPGTSFVFLFGSRASQNFRKTSDYDIGIYTGKKVSLSVIGKIKDALEDYPIPVDVDVVDFSEASADFKKIALKEIKLWNSPKTNLKLM